MAEPTGEHLTAAQREALAAELVEMEGPKRKAAVEAIKVARSFGDLSENFEYHAAKNEQGLLEARIRKLQHRLQHAVTVEHDSGSWAEVLTCAADLDAFTRGLRCGAPGSRAPQPHLRMAEGELRQPAAA